MKTMDTSLDIERLRRETPGCENVLHLNNAGAALMPQPVIDTVNGYFQEEASIGGYETARKYNEQLEQVYVSAARLIGTQAEEIAVLDNATRAWAMAFYSIPFQPGDRILTSVAEYASNTIPYLQRAQRDGVSVEVVPNDEFGQLSVSALKSMMDERVKLVAVTHIPTNGGLVNPAEEIGEIVGPSQAYYLLDACQSVGQKSVDVKALQCDFLSTTSRKFLRGPRGVGFLYVNRKHLETMEPVMLDLHGACLTSETTYQVRDDARRFEMWECNFAAKAGMGAALDYALELGIDAIWSRIQALASQLRESLSVLPDVTVHDQGRVHCGMVSFTVAGHDASTIVDELAARRINVSLSPKEYTMADMTRRGLENVLRASVHCYNTEDELARFCAALAEVTSSSSVGR